jgi:hypothetical protein
METKLIKTNKQQLEKVDFSGKTVYVGIECTLL